jgi:hypothetical protein
MGKTVKDGFKGANAHRYKQNPLEKAFAVAWQEMNSGLGKRYTTIDYLMDPSNRGNPNPPITKRDWHIANTLIQWLGSPVGESFLIDVLASPAGKHFRARLKSELKIRAEKEE